MIAAEPIISFSFFFSFRFSIPSTFYLRNVYFTKTTIHGTLRARYDFVFFFLRRFLDSKTRYGLITV